MNDLLESDIDKINKILYYLSTRYSQDIETLTNSMVSNDLVSLKFDPNFYILDPFCGRGSILLEWYKQAWIHLPIDNREEKNSFILDRIYGNDIDRGQILMARKNLIMIQQALKIENIKEPNIYNYNISDLETRLNKSMKFDCIITNPPYNSERNENNSSRDIYPEMVDYAFNLSNRYVIMITKSNWMTKPTKKEFRNKMVQDYNVDKIHHYKENPFQNTDIQGGVSYFVIDKENTKDSFELNGVEYDRNTPMDFLPYELNTDELILLNKFKQLPKIDFSNFRGPSYYDIGTNDSRLLKQDDGNSLTCFVSVQKGTTNYFPNTNISQKILNDLDKYKVFTPSAYGSPYSLGRVFKGHKEICSASLVNWIFDTEEERDLFFDYVNTKLFRVVVSLVKNKKHVYKNIFSLIPHVDLKSLPEVTDEHIYKALNLTEQEIDILEKRFVTENLMR